MQQPDNIVVIPAGQSGCAWWRLALPISNLQKQDQSLNFINLFSDALDVSKLVEERAKAKLIVLQTPGCGEAVEIIRFYQQQKIPAIVEYDDFSFDLDPSNPRYRDLGVKEVKGQWENNTNGFFLNSNLSRFEAYKSALQIADAITTTTPFLADKFRQFNPNVYVLPNSIDFKLWKHIPKPETLTNEIRIGWFGGDSHLKDLQFIAPIIKAILKAYENVKFVMLAPQPLWSVFSDVPPERRDFRNWAGLETYPFLLAGRFFDIGICPLFNSEFNRCKSNIKFLEFAALKVPTVCTDMEPYDCVKPGVTGFLAKNEQDFLVHLSTLIENQELRLKMGLEAYKYAFENYNIENICKLWKETYLKVINHNKTNGKLKCLDLIMQSLKSLTKRVWIPLTSVPTKTE